MPKLEDRAVVREQLMRYIKNNNRTRKMAITTARWHKEANVILIGIMEKSE